jgi:hypothetical protein
LAWRRRIAAISQETVLRPLVSVTSLLFLAGLGALAMALTAGFAALFGTVA